MEGGGASKWSIANLRSANEELRQHVIQLKAELEQERKQSRQAHREKVAGIRTARDEEQAKGLAAREDLKNKMNQERMNEIQMQKEEMERLREMELQLLARQHEEYMKVMTDRHERENAELEKLMKTQVYQQARREIQEQFDVEKRRLMHEMFEMQTVKNDAEKRMQIATDSDREKAEKIRQLNQQHRDEIQRLRRETRQSSKQQTEELKNKERQLHQKEQELAGVARKAAVMKAEKEELEEKLKRVQEAESWQRKSPRAATPGLGDLSFEAVTTPTHMKRFSDEEKRRIAHNAELTQSNRRLEEKNGILTREKDDLQRELNEARSKSQPLEAKCEKLMKKNNQLVTTVRDYDRKMKKLKEESDCMREERDALVQKTDQLEKNAKRQPTRIGEKQLAGYKNEIDVRNQQLEEHKNTIAKLKEKNVRLKKRLEVVKQSRMALIIERDQTRSPPGLGKSWDEESMGSTLQEDLDQAVFDKDETEEKYKEIMKERLKLERSYAQMQVKLGTNLDVEREKMMNEQMVMDLSEARKKISILETKLKEQARNVEEIVRDEKRGLEEKVKEQEERLQQVESELAAAREENEMQATNLKKELEEALNESGDQKQELMDVQEQLNLSVTESAEHKAAREDAEQVVSDLRQELEGLKVSLLECERQRVDQNEQAEQLAERQGEIERLRKSLEDIETAQTAEALTRAEMERTIDSLSAAVADAETRNSELCDAHCVEIKRLEEELENVTKRQSDDVNLAVEQLETQLQLATTKAETHRVTAEENSRQVEELEIKVKELEERDRENEEAAGALLTVQERNRELEQRLTAAEMKSTADHQLLTESEQQSEDILQQEINTLRDSDRVMKEELEMLRDNEQRLREEVKSLQNNELKNSIEELRETEKKLRREIEEQKNQLTEVASAKPMSLDTSSIAFVSVHDQEGEASEYMQVLRNRIEELESLMKGTQHKMIEQEAKRILSLRGVENVGGELQNKDDMELGHVCDKHDEGEHVPPLPETGPPSLDDVLVDSHDVSTASMVNDYTTKIDELEAELIALAENFKASEIQRKEAEESLVSLKMRNQTLERTAAEVERLQNQNEELERENMELTTEVAKLSVVEESHAKLQSQVQENDGVLKARQSDLNRLQRERDEILRRNVLLTQQVQDLNAAVDESANMKEKINELEQRRASDYKQYSEDLQRSSRMLDDEMKRRTEAESRLAPLQAENKFLERKSTAKDDIITDLNNQLTKLKKAITGSLLEDLTGLDEETEMERRGFGKVMKNRSMGSMDLSEALRTIDEAHLINGLPQTASSDDAPSPLIRMANERSSMSSVQPSNTSSRLSHRSGSPFMENKRMFVTLFDYDPDALCTTQQPELELTLQAGDVIAISGDMNESGMYLAEHEGRQGLIPANFVEELDVNDPLCKSRTINKSSSLDVGPHSRSSSVQRSTSPAYISQQPALFTDLPEETHLNEWNGSVQGDVLEDDPEPPDQLCVERQLDDSLLVAWKPPDLSPLGESNGTIVAGYKVYVDEEEHSLLLGAEKTKALLENIDVMSPRQIGLQTVGRNGRVSQIVSMKFSGRSSLTSSQYDLFTGATSLHLDDNNSVGRDSVTTFNDGIEPFTMYVALYNYHPPTMSPNPDPEAELEFKEGDLIKVFGEENEDGFYSAKLNGRLGLVPSNFIEPVSSAWRQQRSVMVRQAHEQRIRIGNSTSPGGAHFSDSEDLQSHSDMSDVSSDAATDAKRSFVGVYPQMPHTTSDLSISANNRMSDSQTAMRRNVSFGSTSDESGPRGDVQLASKKPSVLTKGKRLFKRISSITRSTSKSHSSTPS